MSHAPNNSSTLTRRILRYGPLVFWTGLILFASTQSFSAGNTSRIIRPLLLWLFPDISETQLINIHFFTRKAAHFIEYAILAFFAYRAFVTSIRDFLREHWFATSLILVAVVAAIDELNQSRIPARTGSPYDSAIDIAGGLTMLLLIAWYQRRRHKLRYSR